MHAGKFSRQKLRGSIKLEMRMNVLIREEGMHDDDDDGDDDDYGDDDDDDVDI